MRAKPAPRRNIKDTVFTHLFKDKEYALQLFYALHPEATGVTEENIEIVTLENVLVGDLYNDLGFMVGDRLIVLVEAQSTFTVNIIVRVMMYYMYTLKNYIVEHKLYLYDGAAVPLPEPEFYVIYTGNKPVDKDIINFADEFFGGKRVAIQAWVRVLTTGKQGDIICQYVTFTKVLDGQIKLHGKTVKAIEETIRICKDMDVLKEYLTRHEQEVQDMMITLFDNDTIMEAFAKAKVDEGRASGLAEGRASGLAEGRASGLAEGRASGLAEGRTEGAKKQSVEIAKNLILMGLPDDRISSATGLSLLEVAAIRASMVH